MGYISFTYEYESINNDNDDSRVLFDFFTFRHKLLHHIYITKT